MSTDTVPTYDSVPPLADRAADVMLAELGALRCRVRGEDDTAACAEAERQRSAWGDTPLDVISRTFGLSAFERATLLLAAAPTLVAESGRELEVATGAPFLSFGAALALLPDAHWSALAPHGPLRSHRLVTVEDPTRLTTARLVVDEPVVHALVGLGFDDPALDPVVDVIEAPGEPLPSHVDAADRLYRLWLDGPVRLDGATGDDARAIVAAAASPGVAVELIVAELPTERDVFADLLLRVARAARLGTIAVLVRVDQASPQQRDRMARALRGVPRVATVGGAASATIAVRPVGLGERVDALRARFAAAGVEGDAEAIATAFPLSERGVSEVVDAAARGEDAWGAARRAVRGFGTLADRIEPRARWDDLVLPDGARAQLRALVAAVRRRRTIVEDWGFGERHRRGLGTAALFCGASGTGKTFAAEVLAAELGRDLLQVDLSQVVSKYIGETEKHLATLFDDAERSGAVLLCDEADALFGKRTEVRDSHDRYANIEVGYLLQRIERFRGLAVLTTNTRSSIDLAFMRRLDAIVTFPYPDVAARKCLWERAFPERMPRGELDLDTLARIDASGGTIVAAAFTAAALAADDGGRVSTSHAEQAVVWELAKVGR